MSTTYADDYQAVFSRDIVHLGRHPETPVHAPSLFDTGQSLLAVHGFAKVGGTEGYGDIYRSTDNGDTWSHQCKLPTYHCGSFFSMGNALYLLYADFRHDNKTRIRKSTNDGVDWSEPVVIHKQALWDGNGAWARHKGYLYKPLDESQPENANGPRSMPRVLRIRLGTSPMVPANWQLSERPNFDFPPPPEVRDVQVEKGRVRRNNNEGNCVVGPDGKLRVIYRHFERTRGIFSATVFYDEQNHTQHFRNVYNPDPPEGGENCYSDFPGACSGFHIRYDEKSGKYIALANPVTGDTSYPDGRPLGIYRCMRNILVMMESDDLVHWRIAKHLLKDDKENTWEESVKKNGFQQVNFEFQGDDLIWISRTAYDGVANLHDANRITFHRLPNFRQYLDPDGEVAHYSFDDPEHPGNDQCKQAGPGVDGGNRATPVKLRPVPGRVGGAAAFDGDGAKLDPGWRIGPELHRAPAVTVAAWLYLDTVPAEDDRALIFDTSIHQGYVGIGLGISQGKLTIGARSCRQDACQLLRSATPPVKTWFHVTAIVDFAGDKLELYINGQKVAEENAVFAENRFLRGIPTERDTIGQGLRGPIDEMHIYRRRISAAEIRQFSGRR